MIKRLAIDVTDNVVKLFIDIWSGMSIVGQKTYSRSRVFYFTTYKVKGVTVY